MADRQPTALAQEGADPKPGRWPAPYDAVAREDRRVYAGEGRVLVTQPAADKALDNAGDRL